MVKSSSLPSPESEDRGRSEKVGERVIKLQQSTKLRELITYTDKFHCRCPFLCPYKLKMQRSPISRCQCVGTLVNHTWQASLRGRNNPNLHAILAHTSRWETLQDVGKG